MNYNLCCLSVQCSLQNFVFADGRKWLPSKTVQLLLISNISRLSLFCFDFDLNQSQRTKSRYPEMVIARTVRSLNMITTSLLILSSCLSNSATSHVKLSVLTADVKTVTNLNSFNSFNVNVQSNSLIFSLHFQELTCIIKTLPSGR